MPAGSFARFARRKKVKAETHPDSCTTTHSPRERVSRNGFNLHSHCTMLRICCVPTGVVGSGAFAAFSLSRSWGSGGWSQIPKTERSPFVENRLGQAGRAPHRYATREKLWQSIHTAPETHAYKLQMCSLHFACSSWYVYVVAASLRLVPY